MIVETVMTRDLAALRAAPRRASSADLVELRLDGLDRPDVAGALAGRRRPVIVTCRAAWEGGHFRGSEDERVAHPAQALAAGAEFVDIEWRATDAAHLVTPAARQRIVLSMHDFDGTPADLAERVRDDARARHRHRQGSPCRPRGSPSCGRCSGSAARRRRPRRSAPCSSAWACRRASRMLPAHFGSCWTYGGPAVAPGQIPVARLRRRVPRPRDHRDTPVYAVVGKPIAHSVSPAMHNAGVRRRCSASTRSTCRARRPDFDDFLALAAALPIAGASVTAPFKEAAWAAQRRVEIVGGAGAMRTR